MVVAWNGAVGFARQTSMRWQSSLMSASSVSPSTILWMNGTKSSRSEHVERSVPMHSYAVLRASNPSSTLRAQEWYTRRVDACSIRSTLHAMCL